MNRVARTRRSYAVVSSLLLISLILMTLYLRGMSGTPLVGSIVFTALYPFQAGIAQATGSVRSLWDRYLALVALKEKNLVLAERVSQLEGENRTYEEMVQRFESLLRLERMRESIATPTLSAEIIGYDATNWTNAVFINRGQRSGLRHNMAVVTDKGLLGRVVESGPNSSKVLLVTDWRSAVDAMVQRTRARGVVVGRAGEGAEMKYIPLNADVKVGDQVVSSGLGGVFPRGLLIGVVTNVQVDTQGLFQQAMVKPHADVAQAEDLLVLLNRVDRKWESLLDRSLDQ